jgi:crotonobetainyl-CoA:carnitine CoA-transferase CaiB-like acyl-CoA transferase
MGGAVQDDLVPGRRLDRVVKLAEYGGRAVYALIRQEMLTGTTDEWLDKLNAADIPATPLHTLESIFDDPHLKATGFFEQYDHPTEGKLLMMRARRTGRRRRPGSGVPPRASARTPPRS